WSEAFPDADIVFRNFDRARAAGAIDRELAAIIGAEAASVEPIGALINPGLSAEFVEVVRAISETVPDSFNTSLLLDLQEGMACTPFGFCQDVTTQFENAYIDANRRLVASIPNEFDDFAVPGWIAEGADITGRLTDQHLTQAFVRCFQFSE